VYKPNVPEAAAGLVQKQTRLGRLHSFIHSLNNK
jgi:hypothetical protein